MKSARFVGKTRVFIEVSGLFFSISVFSVELCIFLDYYLSVLLDGVEAKSQRYILPKLFDIGLLLLILEVNCFL